MRQKGEMILEASKKIKKTKMKQKGSISEAEVRERMKSKRVVVASRHLK
jgi:hypothetical protein